MNRTLKLLALRLRRVAREFQLSTVLGWAGAGLGFLTIAIGAWSIEHAKWIEPAPSLITSLALSLAAAFVLAYVRLKWTISTLLVVAAGLVVAGWQATILYQPTAEISRFGQFWQSISGARPSEASVFFVLFLVLITWLIGFYGAWFILRKRNAWPAVVLGAVMLLTNLTNLPREEVFFFPLFALCAVATIAVTRLAAQGNGMLRWREKFVRKGLFNFVTCVLVVSVTISGISYGLPEPPLEKIGLKLDTSAVNGKNLNDLWFNVFAAVRSKWTTMKSNEQEKLLFKNPLESGSQMHFVIDAARSDYWRTRRYDVYQPWGWSSTVESGPSQPPGTVLNAEAEVSATQTVTYTVQNLLKTDVTLAQGEMATINIPVQVQVFAPVTANASTSYNSPGAFNALSTAGLAFPPGDGVAVVTGTNGTMTLSGQFSSTRANSGSMVITSRGPTEFAATGGVYAGQSSSRTSPPANNTPNAGNAIAAPITAVAESPTTDIAAVVSAKLLRPYESYRVTAVISTATPKQLAAAGADYPAPVMARYLQLPVSIPSRVRSQAATITRNAKTPYDKAMAVKTYLQDFQYDLNAPAPPENTDGAAYFLFTSRRGVCTNFASTMAVMLRSAGVPTRLAAGYLRGEKDPATGQWVVRSKNYHAWVEVYFPTYGWIPFEATPSTEAVSTGETDEDIYNYSFTEPTELPPWMIDEMIPGVITFTGSPPSSTTRSLPWPFIYLVTIGTLLFAAVFIAREIMDRWVKQLQHATSAAETYARLCHLASRGRTGPFQHETPVEFGRRLTRYLPAQEEDIGLVTGAFTRTTYSPYRTMDETSKVRMEKAWVELTPALVRHMMRLRPWSILRLIWRP